MFYMPQGQGKEKGKHMPYKKEYFSIYCSKLLTFNGIKFNTNNLRHLYVTGWLDFTNHPSFQQQVLEHVTKDASHMMLNSVKVWGTSYDDGQVDRSLLTTLHHWPKFQEFMKQKYLDKASEVAIDPLTFDFTSM